MKTSADVALRDGASRLQGMASDLRTLIAAIGSMDASDLADTAQKIALAREWARIQKVGAEMREDLLTAEMLCLSRIGALGATDVLPANQRQCALYFAGCHPERLRELAQEYARSTTALSVHLQIMKRDQRREGEARGQAWCARGTDPQSDDYYETWGAFDEELTDRVRQQQGRLNRSLAVLLESYDDQGFTIADMADEAVERLLGEGTEVRDPGFIEGVREVCRRVVRSAPVEMVAGHAAPKFVTCQTPNGMWLRVPFAKATVGQLREMLALREEQLEQDKAALARLASIVDAYGDQSDAAPCVLERHEMDDVA